MAEDGLTAHVPERRGYGSYGGETTPAPGNLADRDFTAGMPNGKRPADITRDQGPGWEDVPLAAGRLTRWRDRRVCGRFRSRRRVSQQDARQGRGNAAGGSASLGRSDRGCHCRWPGWLAFMGRYGLARSTGVKGRSPGNAAAEGFFGRMKTESVHPGRWEERTRDEVLVPVDDCIRWYDHERIKRSLGWMGPVRYRQSRGMAAWPSPRKRPQPPTPMDKARISAHFRIPALT